MPNRSNCNDDCSWHWKESWKQQGRDEEEKREETGTIWQLLLLLLVIIYVGCSPSLASVNFFDV